MVNMSEIVRHSDAPALEPQYMSMSTLLPTGAVTLLLADIEGSTRLWQTQPEQMPTAMAHLDRTITAVVTAHRGVRPVEQGEGDSFVAAFVHASDAAACALELQRTVAEPIQLRIGLHTGEVQLRDEANYVGLTINRTARLRDLAHGGQIVLSATTADLVIDKLPPEAWLVDLGSHQLRDLPRSERVMQLCHRDLREGFPPLRAQKTAVSFKFPVHLTTFVGRTAQIAQVRELLAENRVVTLSGSGGVGKTRLAIEVAAESDFRDGLWYVDLTPVADPDAVPGTAAHALGLLDQPGRSAIDVLSHFLGGRKMLMVLDNCEHLLDACAGLVVPLLGACPELTVLATSREPLGVAGEVMWAVPSLSIADEAVELFTDRARLAQPAFAITDDNTQAVAEICRRLDGIPLAIELAAARVRSLSPAEIAEGLDDRFRLLTGSARSLVQRQQTLRASIDWSYELLTDTERILFRHLSVFPGGFDLAAAQAVAGDGFEPFQVLNQLTSLVDKSLVVVEDSQERTRYRLLETVREYGAEKLATTDENELRARHRDYCTELAALLDVPGNSGNLQLVEQAEREIDNLRAAFVWSRGNGDATTALRLASSLQPIWLGRGRQREGLAWFDPILDAGHDSYPEVPAGVWARALADKVMLSTLLAVTPVGDGVGVTQAHQALVMARDLDDTVVLVRALTACGWSSGFATEVSRPYLDEAGELARALNDKWMLSQIRYWQLVGFSITAEPIAIRVAAEQALKLADTIGDRFVSRQSRLWFISAQMWEGDLARALTAYSDITAEAETANDVVTKTHSLYIQAVGLAYHDADAALAVAAACLQAASELGGGVYEILGHAAMIRAALAAGAIIWAEASEASWSDIGAQQELIPVNGDLNALLAFVRGDIMAARRFADHAVHRSSGWPQVNALVTRAHIAVAQGELAQARDDAHSALVGSAEWGAYLGTLDAIEILAGIASEASSHEAAARLFGATSALRQRTGEVRFKIWDADYEASLTALRESMSAESFETAWAAGAAMSQEETIAYAQRGRGKRKRRPARGWDALTPTERNIVQLVSEGLASKDVAARLFISPRTVQTHLTHIYAKLGITSRVQLVQEVGRHSD